MNIIAMIITIYDDNGKTLIIIWNIIMVWKWLYFTMKMIIIILFNVIIMHCN